MKAQLTSLKEQAEANFPSVLPSLDLLLKEVDKLSGTSKNKAMLAGTIEFWTKCVREHGNGDALERAIQSFRRMIEGDKNDTRTPKDAALITYLALHVIEMGGVYCAMESGFQLMKTTDEKSTSIIMQSIIATIKEHSDSAQCLLGSLGVNSPQEAAIQLEWLAKVVVKKAKDAKIDWVLADVSGGKVRFDTDSNSNTGFIWKK